MKLQAAIIVKALDRFNPIVTVAKSGSIYITLSGSKVKQIRLANHNGHNLKRNVWQLRSDAMTTRKNPQNRIYNISAINQLIKDIK